MEIFLWNHMKAKILEDENYYVSSFTIILPYFFSFKLIIFILQLKPKKLKFSH